jgi:hypothetical protein
MNEIDSLVTQPVKITLPNGEQIEVESVPYEGWGHKPGQWYLIVKCDDDGNELSRHAWSIPTGE